MREYDLITWILNDDYLCNEDEENVMVENQGDEHTEQRVRIVNKVHAISRMSLYRFDEKKTGKDFLPFFNDKYGLTKVHAPRELRSFCDYILLVECRDSLYVMLIELKRGGHSGYKKQIEGSVSFMDYIISSAVRIQHENAFNDFNKANIHYRKILLKKCESDKGETHNVDLNFDKNDFIEIRCMSEFRPIRVI